MSRIVPVDAATPTQINAALEANLQGHTRWSSPIDVRCAVAGGAIAASHDLGDVPTVVDVVPWVDSRVWFDADDRRNWTNSAVSFHASAVGLYTVMVGIR